MHLDRRDYYVTDLALQEARAMVEAEHYAKGSSNTAVYSHGLHWLLSPRAVGAALWLPPTRVACESVNKDEWKKVLSLSRLVILPNQPTNAASYLLGQSIQKIKREKRFVSLVTYADESQGHTGAIYRATNWTYVGRTGPYPRYVDPVTGRQVATKSTVNRTAAQMRELGYVKTGSFYKHKFVMHLR